ncbi:MAG: bifunctional glutamate N-acetyltransferase/amino-acid acetyltransferase ArgJ [Planctomycetaceae bacterium]|jgi:glutamate N-acetyltransferase/amino-acid N-acetyltransferase|nr:bifunctional glutamate N-acetyltransferase/amino-acid acetyltransferase ArgJ [Planctomycetaceae bacterium]
MTLFIPKGYRFSAVHAGLKSDPDLLDLSLLASDCPAAAAGVFTQNLVCGAPVQYDRQHVPCNDIRCVVVNTRYANACTGKQGIQDAKNMADAASTAVCGETGKGLVMSTGVIGVNLPMDKIIKGVTDANAKLTASENAFVDFAKGMMTTDTVEKYVTKQLHLESGEIVTIAGACKGAAMIAPNLATMLAVILTDAAIEKDIVQKLLTNAAENSFNSISVEGHTSTSDTLLMLANGAAVSRNLADTDLIRFERCVGELCVELAVKIPLDGEGVSHLVIVDLEGCVDLGSARIIARKIAEDVLVKTAIAGADPNWGRVISAVGTAGVNFDPSKLSFYLNGFELFRNGEPQNFDKKTVANSIRNNRETTLKLIFGEGTAKTKFWTTDLTTEYVRLNSDYTT